MLTKKNFQFVGIFILGLIIGVGIVGSLNTPSQNPNENNLTSETCEVEIGQKNLEGKLGQEISEKELKAAEAFLTFRDLKSEIIPSGVPVAYGKELAVSYNEVQDAIDKIKIYGPDYGEEAINLSAQQKKRYKEIGSQTSCEYCCGVEALIREDGSAACGCEHSIMMRGLIAYLLNNHPDLSNKEILETVNNWKTTFFPQQTLTQELNRMKETGDEEAVEIMEQFPQFMPSMVGGC